MSVMTVRGGIPFVLRDAAVSTSGRIINIPFLIHSLIVRNKGSNICRLFFTERDFNADENYVEVPVASTTYPYGEWSGPVETAFGEYENLWVKSAAGTSSIELVAFQRRG